MRILVMCLVLVNLGLWAWTHWVLPPPPAATRYDGPGVTLLTELDEDSPLLAATRGDASLPAPQPESGDCVAIGPFIESGAVDSAVATLAAAGFDPRLSNREMEVWDGYWVYIERIGSRDEADAMRAELVANGIEDAYVIPDADNGILISLGVFSEAARAASLVSQVSAMGYEATLSDRMRTAQTTWLELTLAGQTSAALELLQEPGEISRLEQRDCGGPL